MSKLSNNQIDDLISQENHIGENIDVMKGGKTLPRNARSVFTFEITESVGDVLSNILHPRGDKKDNWDIQHLEDGKLWMWDKNWPCCAKVEYSDKEMKIETATAQYSYHIKPNKGRKGCLVEFQGPLNGLMNQVILPKMTYVHHTLEGKFVDQAGKDLTKFMPISEYCMLRDAKNKQPDENGKTGNLQDYYGYQVNMKFNNEIPSFSIYTPNDRMQKYILEKGQKSFGKTVDVSAKKEEILNRMREIHGQDKTKHGVVAADEAAKVYIAQKAYERD